MDDLPNKYDMVVIGTGMPECILAAAAARVGKSVLHLDRNGHYGGNWASFNFDQLLTYLEAEQAFPEIPPDRMMEVSWLEQLNDNERLILCPKTGASLFNIMQKTYIKDEPIQEPPLPVAADSEDASPGLNSTEADDSHETEIATAQSSESPLPGGSSDPEIPNILVQHEPIIEITDENSGEASPSSESQMAFGDGSTDSVSDDSNKDPTAVKKTRQEWTFSDLKENRRKFNLDLSPKLLYARGSLVELLITSNIARYAEFQCVNRVLTYICGHLEQVPCSRADVFSTKNVSVVEKRMLMKLLTFCMEYQKHPDEYRGFEGRPFIEFLRSRKVTPNIEHYILHAIAMVDESCPTLQGLSATQKFMESLGRYGNSPFLWSSFGSAELPQCFCRLCAVFGGIYYLKRDADAVILDTDDKCVGVITYGKKIECQALVMEYTYSPLLYVPESIETVSRAIYITDSSILPAERQQNTLLRLPPIAGVRNVITVLEFGSLSYICPDNLYAVHMICHSLHDSVEEDFKSSEQDLFSSTSSGEQEETEKTEDSKPHILWCAYFRHKDTTLVDINSKVPAQLFLTSSPGSEQDYEHAVSQARDIFLKLYPEEEFLPRAPDPEDIIMDECSNPGDGNGFEEENPELKDIENDVKSDEPECDQGVASMLISNIEASPKTAETAECDTQNKE